MLFRDRMAFICRDGGPHDGGDLAQGSGVLAKENTEHRSRSIRLAFAVAYRPTMNRC